MVKFYAFLCYSIYYLTNNYLRGAPVKDYYAVGTLVLSWSVWTTIVWAVKGILLGNQHLMTFLVVLLIVLMTVAFATRKVIIRNEKAFAEVDKGLVISVALSILLWDIFALASMVLN